MNATGVLRAGPICRATVREGSHRELLENKKSVQAQDEDRKISEMVSSRPDGDNQSGTSGTRAEAPQRDRKWPGKKDLALQSQRQRNGLNGLWR